MDGNGALFVNVLCDIQILRTRLICNFGWKHSYCLLILMFPNLHDFLMWNTKKFWRMFMLLIFHTMKVDGDQKVPCMHHKSSPNNLCVFWHYRKNCYLYSMLFVFNYKLVFIFNGKSCSQNLGWLPFTLIVEKSSFDIQWRWIENRAVQQKHKESNAFEDHRMKFNLAVIHFHCVKKSSLDILPISFCVPQKKVSHGFWNSDGV